MFECSESELLRGWFLHDDLLAGLLEGLLLKLVVALDG
jgi:hypothetical protein